MNNSIPKGVDDALMAGLETKPAKGQKKAELLKSARETAGVGERPQCEVSADWGRTMNNMVDALYDVDEELLLFQKDGVLLACKESGSGLRHFDSTNVLKTVLAKYIDFGYAKKNKDGDEAWINKSPPNGIVDSMRAAPDLFEPVKPLRRHVSAPTIFPDNTITEESGYYRDFQLYYDGSIGLGDTGMSLEEAVANLEEPFADFPFVDASDFANALAVPLSIIGYDLFQGAPPINIPIAPTYGSGKSLLVEAPCILTSGRAPLTIEYIDSEEFSKTIASSMLDAPQCAMIDNIEGYFHSAKLCSMMSQSETSSRLLGTNTVVTIKNETVWFANGNNIELSGDLIRRSYLVRINARMESPEERTGFKIKDLKNWSKDPVNQRRYVASILVIIRKWLEAGAPRFKTRRLGSFVDWCEVIGGILSFIGHGDFLGNKDHFKATSDPEKEMWREFVAEWWRHYRHAEVKSGDLYNLVQLEDPSKSFDASYNHRDTPLLALGNGTIRSQKTKMGTLLRKKVGQVFNVRTRDGVAALQIERVTGNLSHTRYFLKPVIGDGEDVGENLLSDDEEILF